MSQADPNEPPRWLDDFANVRKVYIALWVVCLVLLVGGEGLLIFAHHRAAEAGEVHHGFSFESWPGFYSLYGFIGCVTLVLGAKELRKLIMRGEDYYGD
jgi:hypothetical protein